MRWNRSTGRTSIRWSRRWPRLAVGLARRPTCRGWSKKPDDYRGAQRRLLWRLARGGVPRAGRRRARAGTARAAGVRPRPFALPCDLHALCHCIQRAGCAARHGKDGPVRCWVYGRRTLGLDDLKSRLGLPSGLEGSRHERGRIFRRRSIWSPRRSSSIPGRYRVTTSRT